jgi:uncharacterized protein (TIGR03118 family)
LNAPWGIAFAPSNFGAFSGDLLIGNFGDGQINAYADGTWERAGGLRDASGQQIVTEGLWGIGFRNGVTAGPTNTLYFAAAPNDENDGLFGSITATERGRARGPRPARAFTCRVPAPGAARLSALPS